MSLKRTVLPVGDWTPDSPDYGNTGITALNVIPWANSYKSFPAMVSFSTALTAACQGAYFARDSAANVYNYAGDATKLYALANTGTYSNVSRLAGGAYATAVDDWWEFTQWGQTVIGTNYIDVPQVITLGAANFAALAGSPPNARHLAVIKDFVVFGNVNYGGTQYPNRVYWGGLNSSILWTISSATQCDIQDLQGDGGWIQKIIGGEYGLVFLERQVWRMTYVGSPVIFQFDLVERARGAYCPQGVIGWGNMVFFIAEDGFYIIIGGGGAQPIGNDKVDKYFLNTLKTAFNYRVNATIDPVNKLVMWAWPGSGSTSGRPNQILIYNWGIGQGQFGANPAAGKWSLVTVDTEAFARYASIGYTLEGLDAVSTNLDTLTPSLDSRTWTGGAQSLAAFDSTHKLNTFSGTAMDATVDTGEKQLESGMRAIVSNSRPLVDGEAATVAMRTRERLADTASYGSAVTQNANGYCPQRSSAMYHAARVATTGAFNFIQGVEVFHDTDGFR